MNKSERRKLDNEYLDSIEWMGWDCIPDEFKEDESDCIPENELKITWAEVRDYLEDYKSKTMLLANFLPDVNSLIGKTIDAIDCEDEEVFDLYFKRLCNFMEMLKKYMEV